MKLALEREIRLGDGVEDEELKLEKRLKKVA